MNIIERMNKEIRRRVKIIDSLLSENNAMKIINDTEINEKQSLRSPRRFYKCQYAIGKCPRGGIINLTQFLGHYSR